MALTPQEREKVRYHLGYPSTAQMASIQLGIPRPIQSLFLVEQAMNLLIADAEIRVRQMLAKMDLIESKLLEQVTDDHLAAIRLEDLYLRARSAGGGGNTEGELLEEEYQRWGWRLADELGVPVYPYSKRYRVNGGSVPVRND